MKLDNHETGVSFEEMSNKELKKIILWIWERCVLVLISKCSPNTEECVHIKG